MKYFLLGTITDNVLLVTKNLIRDSSPIKRNFFQNLSSSQFYCKFGYLAFIFLFSLVVFWIFLSRLISRGWCVTVWWNSEMLFNYNRPPQLMTPDRRHAMKEGVRFNNRVVSFLIPSVQNDHFLHPPGDFLSHNDVQIPVGPHISLHNFTYQNGGWYSFTPNLSGMSPLDYNFFYCRAVALTDRWGSRPPRRWSH